nr:tRNA 2-thiocytidine(32) synthetase TtcA [Suttonella sp. R2A3]
MSVTLRKLQKRLRKYTGQAIEDYRMIEDGDRVMVCLSGGKDSYAMLDLLLSLQRSAPVDFSLTAVNLDQKQPGFPEHILPEYLESIGVDYHIIESDTYSVVTDKIEPGNTMCSLCSRLRRGHLYSYAKAHGMTKIALGHHRFDIMETFFLNLFHGGQLKAMPPKLQSDDGEHIVIRPLAYCDERDIAKYAEWKQFPIIPCNLCGSQDGLQRQVVKEMLLSWEQSHPQRLNSLFAALCNVRPSHLLDRTLYDFANLGSDGTDVSWLVSEPREPVNTPTKSQEQPLIFHPQTNN